jgi:hypothetical protein
MAKEKIAPKNATVVSVVGYADAEERGIFDRRIARGVIDVDKLAEEVRAFMAGMEQIIGNLAGEVGKYHMDTVSVSAEVSAKGKVSLLGSGGEMGGRGGMTFTFKAPSKANG